MTVDHFGMTLVAKNIEHQSDTLMSLYQDAHRGEALALLNASADAADALPVILPQIPDRDELSAHYPWLDGMLSIVLPRPAAPLTCGQLERPACFGRLLVHRQVYRPRGAWLAAINNTRRGNATAGSAADATISSGGEEATASGDANATSGDAAIDATRLTALNGTARNAAAPPANANASLGRADGRHFFASTEQAAQFRAHATSALGLPAVCPGPEWQRTVTLIYRHDARGYVNTEQMIAALQQTVDGYRNQGWRLKLVEPSTEPLRAQAAHWACSDLVVTVHGAHAANMMFLRNTSGVVMTAPCGCAGRSGFMVGLAADAGLCYWDTLEDCAPGQARPQCEQSRLAPHGDTPTQTAHFELNWQVPIERALERLSGERGEMCGPKHWPRAKSRSASAAASAHKAAGQATTSLWARLSGRLFDSVRESVNI